jgi:hypothetical protein
MSTDRSRRDSRWGCRGVSRNLLSTRHPQPATMLDGMGDRLAPNGGSACSESVITMPGLPDRLPYSGFGLSGTCSVPRRSPKSCA